MITMLIIHLPAALSVVNCKMYRVISPVALTIITLMHSENVKQKNPNFKFYIKFYRHFHKIES